MRDCALPIKRLLLLPALAAFTSCSDAGPLPVGPDEVEVPAVQAAAWDLTGENQLLERFNSTDAQMTCQGGVESNGDAWIWCSCPATMLFDGAGGCECANGGEGIDCDLGGGDPDGGDPGGGDPGGGDPGGPGGPGGGDPPDPPPTDDNYARGELSCPAVVQLGKVITCTLTKPNGNDHFSAISWRFESVHMSGTPQQAGGTTWTGRMIKSGSVVVNFSLNGVPQGLTQSITVTPRIWSWKSKLSTGQASPGQYDSCFASPGDLGQTVGTDCANNSGALLAPANPNFGWTSIAGSGINAGAGWVVADNPTKKLSVRTQINEEFRIDGAAHVVASPSSLVSACAAAYPSGVPNLNTKTLNQNCATSPATQFGALVSNIWSHEALHMNAAKTEAEKATNDLHDLWDNLVGDTQSDLQYQVIAATNAVNTPIEIAASNAVVHAGLPNVSFTIWRWTGSAWSWYTVNTLGY